jgi:hypothetical protein
VQKGRLDGVLGVLARAQPTVAVAEDLGGMPLEEGGCGGRVCGELERLEPGGSTGGRSCFHEVPPVAWTMRKRDAPSHEVSHARIGPHSLDRGIRGSGASFRAFDELP